MSEHTRDLIQNLVIIVVAISSAIQMFNTRGRLRPVKLLLAISFGATSLIQLSLLTGILDQRPVWLEVLSWMFLACMMFGIAADIWITWTNKQTSRASVAKAGQGH